MKTCLDIHDVPPKAVQADIESLQQSLKGVIPSKWLDENLLIATWNIRGFASLTRKWTAGDADSTKRDLRGLLEIQEVKGDLRALRDLIKWLLLVVLAVISSLILWRIGDMFQA
jgi:hypothetical protein